MEKLEIRVVIKYFCKKGMPPKEIHEDFMETHGKESLFYSTVKKMGSRVQEAERESVAYEGRSAYPPPPPKDAPLIKMSRSCTPCLCVIGDETCKA